MFFEVMGPPSRAAGLALPPSEECTEAVLLVLGPKAAVLIAAPPAATTP